MYLRPTSLDEAVAALATPGIRVLAGGTDVFPALADRPLQGPVLDITAVADLAGIAEQEGGWRIGARTRWSEIVRAALPAGFAGLKAAAREVGAVQIQTVGTIGGNLCNASPAADGVPPLVALDASVELVSARGRRVLPVSDFVLGNRRTALAPGELVAAILVPRESGDMRSHFAKLGARRYLVISIASVAASLAVGPSGEIERARVVVGACSIVPRRLSRVEAMLAGVALRPGLGAMVEPEHLAVLSPIDDVRATADYRRDAALTLVRRALEALAEEAA